MQILCPKFFGREICGDETAVFFEDSVSRFLGHEFPGVPLIFSLGRATSIISSCRAVLSWSGSSPRPTRPRSMHTVLSVCGDRSQEYPCGSFDLR